MNKKLLNLKLPNISLDATNKSQVNLSLLHNIIVIYIYPKTSSPNETSFKNWDIIPGAKGCTAQSCSFRDYHDELNKLNCTLFGLSVQSTSYQKEVKERLHLPFELLSDENFDFINKLSLPTMKVENTILAQRLTLICKDGIIKKIFYPIDNPENNVVNVLNYIKNKILV